MVFEMVLGERQGAREGLWQVGEQRRQDVRQLSLEHQPVRGLVDHDEERVVGERAHRVGDDHDDPPRPVGHEPCDDDLERDDARRPPERSGVGADELPDLGMIPQQLPRPEPMRFRSSGKRELGARSLHGHSGKKVIASPAPR